MILIHDRKVLVEVLIYHTRANAHSCSCGWGADYSQLGKSFPEHVATVYEESLRANA